MTQKPVGNAACFSSRLSRSELLYCASCTFHTPSPIIPLNKKKRRLAPVAWRANSIIIASPWHPTRRTSPLCTTIENGLGCSLIFRWGRLYSFACTFRTCGNGLFGAVVTLSPLSWLGQVFVSAAANRLRSVKNEAGFEQALFDMLSALLARPQWYWRSKKFCILIQ